MKLHKTLQLVRLDTSGKFISRINSAEIENNFNTSLETTIENILAHKYFDDEHLLEERLEEVGLFLERTRDVGYTLEDIKIILDGELDKLDKFTEEDDYTIGVMLQGGEYKQISLGDIQSIEYKNPSERSMGGWEVLYKGKQFGNILYSEREAAGLAAKWEEYNVSK
jgi:hypothetical protein